MARDNFGRMTLIVIVNRASRSERGDPVMASTKIDLTVNSSYVRVEGFVQEGIRTTSSCDSL